MTNGYGKLTLTNGARLELGRIYTLTAKPARGNVLGWWRVSTNAGTADDFQWLNSAVRFRMSENLVIESVFITNVFQAALGSYHGLVFHQTNADQLDPQMSGSAAVTITAAGAFSGKISLCSGTYPISGQLELTDNHASYFGPVLGPSQIPGPTNIFHGAYSINRGKLPPLQLKFSFNANQPGALTGVLQTNDADAGIAFSAPSTPYLYHNADEGYYTMTYYGPTKSGGYGTATIDKTGLVRAVIHLPDRVDTVILTVRQQADGSFSLFTPLYSGRKGLFIGTFSVAGGEIFTQNATNSLIWIKPDRSDAYTVGFTESLSAYGSHYARRSTYDLFDWNSGVIELEDGVNYNYSADIDYDGASIYVAPTEDDHLVTFSVNPKTGELSGLFYPNHIWHGISFNGITVGQSVYGFFLGPYRPGWVYLGKSGSN